MGSLEQLNWLYDGSLPLVLFGEKVGAFPLYCGITYNFGVHTGQHILSSLDLNTQKHLRIKVYEVDNSTNKTRNLVYEETIWIPLNKFKEEDSYLKPLFETQWFDDYIYKAGGIMKVGSAALSERYGLESWVQYTGSPSAWGSRDYSGIILSHRSNSTKYSYEVQLIHSIGNMFRSLYVLNFSEAPPAIASIVQQPYFMWEPRPGGYWGTITTITNEQIKKISNPDFLGLETCNAKYCSATPNDTDLVNQFYAKLNPEESELKHVNDTYKGNSTNTPVSYALLDDFVHKRKDAQII